MQQVQCHSRHLVASRCPDLVSICCAPQAFAEIWMLSCEGETVGFCAGMLGEDLDVIFQPQAVI